MPETFVVEGVPELQRALNPDRWWLALEHVVPRALAPVAARIPSMAPRGRTGKLSRSPITIRTDRLHAGLVHGLTVALGSGMPYAHLVERGHRVVARGATRFTAAARSAQGTRALRGRERTALKQRRAAGGIGFVAARPFAQPTFEAAEPQIQGLIEKLLAVEITRAV